MQEAKLLTEPFGWTIKVDWDAQARGMNHQKAKKMAAKQATKIKKKKKKKRTDRRRWGIRLQPLQPSIGSGSRSIDHYFATSPSVQRAKNRVDDPFERRKNLEKQRRRPRQRVDDDSRACGTHKKYHERRMAASAGVGRPSDEVSVTFLTDNRDDTLFMAAASRHHFLCVSSANEPVTVLRGPLCSLDALLLLLKNELRPHARAQRIVSDDFEILSRHFPNPVQVLNTRIIASLFTRKSHCDAFTSVIKVNQVDGAHGKTDLIMYPDEDWQDGRPARNTIIVRTGGATQKKRRTLLKSMNKKTSVPLVKTEVELLLEQPPDNPLRYARGASMSSILPDMRKHPAQTYSRGTRCTYVGQEKVKHDYTWGYMGETTLGKQSEQASP